VRQTSRQPFQLERVGEDRRSMFAVSAALEPLSEWEIVSHTLAEVGVQETAQEL
jgi:hypothetical protein